MKKIISTVLFTSLVYGALSGCAPLLLGGSLLGGTLVATDRRTAGTQLEDEGIEQRIANSFRSTFIERVHVNVTSYNRQVLLSGEVPTAAAKATAEQIATQAENVKNVVNEIAVLGNTNLIALSSDALITSRVKAALVNDKDLYANAFKIVSERGTVYMMGIVTKREADKATELARSTPGVLKVVRLLEMISDEELKRIQPPPAPAPVQNVPTPISSGSGTPWNAQPAAK